MEYKITKETKEGVIILYFENFDQVVDYICEHSDFYGNIIIERLI